MDLREFVRLVHRQWRVIVVCAALGLMGAALVTWHATPMYRSTATLFVATKDDTASITDLIQSGNFGQQRVSSYAQIVTSPTITQKVAADVGDGVTPHIVSKETSASAVQNTVLITISVEDASPRRAQAIANAVASNFAAYVPVLESTGSGNLSPVKITVVKPASLPVAPASPRKTLDLSLGLVIGLVIGAAGAVLRETLDTSVKSPDQVQAIASLPTIGLIGYDPTARKTPLIARDDPLSPRGEAFRQLRTSLQFLDIDCAPKSIVFTSSVPGEGKTTSITNLAITLAQTGVRVLLVEADLRRPKMGEYLGVDSSVGLTSVLIGRHTLRDAVQPWGWEGLHVLPSGPVPPNPSELLGSQAMHDLLAEIEAAYDLVLIDAPPLLPVTDAAVLAAAASGAVVIVRHGHTNREQFARAVEALRSVGATVYGAVLTMTPRRGPDSYYYYGYKYQATERRQKTPEDVTERSQSFSGVNGHPRSPEAVPGPTSPEPTREREAEVPLVVPGSASSAFGQTEFDQPALPGEPEPADQHSEAGPEVDYANDADEADPEIASPAPFTYSSPTEWQPPEDRF